MHRRFYVLALMLWCGLSARLAAQQTDSVGVATLTPPVGRQLITVTRTGFAPARHRVGGDLMLERPGDYRMGIEGTWYGVQALDDNPYRTESSPSST